VSSVYRKVPGQELLFINPASGIYFLRKRDGKLDTHISLKTTKIKVARDLRDAYQGAIRLKKLGVIPEDEKSQTAGPVADMTADKPKTAEDTEEPPLFETVGEMLDAYATAGYLTEDGEKRTGAMLEMEVRNCKKLKPFWDAVRIEKVRRSKMIKYKDWRLKNTAHGHKGRKATDYDLQTLSNAAKWAISIDRLIVNPFAERPKFQKGKLVKHCRIFCPDDADELHDAAELLMQHPKSVVLGFNLLLESYTGLRGDELHYWGTAEFGNLTQDGKYVKVWRDKNQHLVNPYVELNPGLEATMAAFENWKQKVHPQCKKFLPSPYGDAISEDALSHALLRISPQLKKKLTPHGAGRAFYVLMLRSWGFSDEEISHKIGHTSGGLTIKTTYGGVPRNWRTNAPKLSWLPVNRKPAWESLVLPRRLLEKV
jgi:integrase